MKKKNTVSLLAQQKPDGSVEMQGPEENEENHGLMSAASDLIAAIEAKDVAGVASALEAAFTMCDQDSEMMGDE